QVGDPHPGRDCFVFPRRACAAFEVGDACVGASFVGKVLALNLACQVPTFREFTDAHVTFHLGDDRSWLNPEAQDYEEHNRRPQARAMPTPRRLQRHALVTSVVALIGTLLSLELVPSISLAEHVVVPNSLTPVAGNFQFGNPLACVSSAGERYQQVNRGSEVGSGTITAIAFRREETLIFPDNAPITIST